MLVHPEFDPIAFHIGSFGIHWYGLMYLIGFALFTPSVSIEAARLGETLPKKTWKTCYFWNDRRNSRRTVGIRSFLSAGILLEASAADFCGMAGRHECTRRFYRCDFSYLLFCLAQKEISFDCWRLCGAAGSAGLFLRPFRKLYQRGVVGKGCGSEFSVSDDFPTSRGQHSASSFAAL